MPYSVIDMALMTNKVLTLSLTIDVRFGVDIQSGISNNGPFS